MSVFELKANGRRKGEMLPNSETFFYIRNYFLNIYISLLNLYSRSSTQHSYRTAKLAEWEWEIALKE